MKIKNQLKKFKKITKQILDQLSNEKCEIDQEKEIKDHKWIRYSKLNLLTNKVSPKI